MARTLKLVLPQKPQYNPTVIPAVEIPEDVKADVEDAYKAWKVNPDGRIRAEFDTPEEMALFVRQVKSYCEQHEPVLRYRKTPTKNLTNVQMDFKITDPLTKNEQTTADLRQATDAAKEANADAAVTAAESAPVLDPATAAEVESALQPARKGRAKTAA